MLALAICAVASSCATTTEQRPVPAPVARFSGPAYVPENRRITEPFAHVVFCTSRPAECGQSPSPVAVTLTEDRRDELDEVNQSVNRRIVPRDDPAADTWTLAPRSGDCEDYVVTKRHELLARGWPASALRVAIGTIGSGEGHVVLVVRTTEGDLVLDNLSDDVVPWRQVDMAWLSIQSSINPRIWHAT